METEEKEPEPVSLQELISALIHQISDPKGFILIKHIRWMEHQLKKAKEKQHVE